MYIFGKSKIRFTAIFDCHLNHGRKIGEIPIPSLCRPLDKSYLTIPEKYWIVEHGEKNPDLTAIELAGNFAAKFSRPKPADTILQILNQKKEIRQEFDSWAEVFALELNEAADHNKDRVGILFPSLTFSYL